MTQEAKYQSPKTSKMASEFFAFIFGLAAIFSSGVVAGNLWARFAQQYLVH